MSDVHPHHIKGEIQALKEKLKAPDLSRAEHGAIKAQIAELEGDLEHHADQQQGREERERRENAIARKKAWEAAYALMSGPNDLHDLTTTACEKILELKPLFEQIKAKYTEGRALITTVTNASPDSTDQLPLMIESLWFFAANSGIPIRGFGSHPDFFTPEAVAKLMAGQLAGDLRVFGQRQGYLRADFKPNTDWRPA